MKAFFILLILLASIWASPPIDNPNGLPIIFIHGIGDGSQVWTRVFLKLELKADDISRIQFQSRHYYKIDIPKESDRNIWVIGYYTPDFIEEALMGNLTLYANRLTWAIDEIKYRAKKDQVIIVAHSMGGLVVRKYMTLSRKNWQSVAHLITLGTPNEGVQTSIPVVGQLRDLFTGSAFLNQLDQDWENMLADQELSWCAIAAVRPRLGVTGLTENMTDLAGPGYVTLQSAFTQEEWRSMLVEEPGVWQPGQNIFTYKLLLVDDHVGMIRNPKVEELFRHLIGR